TKARMRIEHLLPLLDEMGIKRERIFFESTATSEGGRLADLVTDFVNKIADMGPLGIELIVTTKSR
ncbi:MAG: hydrogenase iron-sulfur subunit, partial [Candidatus Hodarchaeota archaeon]